MDIRDSSSSLPQPAFNDDDTNARKRRKAPRSSRSRRQQDSVSQLPRPTSSSLQRALVDKEHDDDSVIAPRKKSPAKKRARKKTAKKSRAQQQEEQLDASAISVLDATHFNGQATSAKVRGELPPLIDDSKAAEAALNVPAYLRKKGGKADFMDDVLEERDVDDSVVEPPRKKKRRSNTREKLQKLLDDDSVVDAEVSRAAPKMADTVAPKKRKSKKGDVDLDESVVADDLDESVVEAKPKSKKRKKKAKADDDTKTKKTSSKAKSGKGKKKKQPAVEVVKDVEGPRHVRFAALPTEMVGLGAGALGALLTLALVSFNSADVAILAAGQGAVANWIGPVGAWTAGGLVRVFGLGAFASPVVVFSIAFWCFRRRAVRPRWHQAAGLVLGAVSLATLLDVVFATSTTLTFAAGGLIGAAVASVLTGLLASLGTGIVATLGTGTGVLLAVDRSLSTVVHDSVAFGREVVAVVRELVDVQVEKARMLDEERDLIEEEAHEERLRRKEERQQRREEREERVKERAKRKAKDDIIDELDDESRVLRLPSPDVLDVDLSHAQPPAKAERRPSRSKRDPQWSAQGVNVAHLDASMPRILAPRTFIADAETHALAPTEVLPEKAASTTPSSVQVRDSAIVDAAPAANDDDDTPVVKIAMPEQPALKASPLVDNVEEQADADALDGIVIKERVDADLPVAPDNLDDTLVSPPPSFGDDAIAPKEGEPGEDGEQLVIHDREDAAHIDDNVEAEKEERYELPPLKLLDYDAPERAPLNADNMKALADKLVKTFGDFGIVGKVREIRPGPIVTTYEFVPAPGIKVSRIASLSDDIAMAMEAVHVRIVAPIPGKGAVGIEIPNDQRETVFLKEIIADENFKKEGDSKLKMALGKDIEGKPYYADLGGFPHVLVSGTTGSGKSVSVNGMIASLLYRATPDELKFLMIDPKMLELSIYEGIPHLLLPPIIDTSKAANALRWTVEEMERRYHAMSHLGVRDIKGYNEALQQIRRREHPKFDKLPVDDQGKTFKKAPYIVVVIDEYADLLSTAGKDVEVYVMRLAQKARAAGIHVMLATQRPSVDVITGVIKANFPVRMGFRLASSHDSKTIINRPGAEKLLGRGDMLMLPAGTSDVTRVHGAFVSEVELHRVVNHWKGQGTPNYDMSIVAPPADEKGGDDDDGDAPLDARWDDAIAVVAKSRRCSTSWLQRQLGIGYNRAARIVERLEKEGLVGPQLNSKGDRDIHIPPVD